METKTSNKVFKMLVIIFIILIVLAIVLRSYINANFITKEKQVEKIVDNSFQNGVVRKYSKEQNDRINLLAVIVNEEEFIAGIKDTIIKLQEKEIRTNFNYVIIEGKFIDESKNSIGINLHLDKVKKYNINFNSQEELLKMLSSTH